MKKNAELLAAMGLGLAFSVVIFGIDVINPFSINWIMKGGDAYQHFIGQAFFLSDVWRWPLGANPNFGNELRGSIVFADSIPILALIAKIGVPEAFQPIQIQGLALALNFMLTGGVAFLLCHAVTGNSCASLVVSFLLMSSTIMTMRGAGAHGHESLTAHWTFLLAMLFMVNSNAAEKSRLGAKWTWLLGVTALIHFYLLVMCLLFYAGEVGRRIYWLRHSADRSALAKVMLHVLATGCALLFVMYAAGYFIFSVNVENTSVYGDFPSSTLAFINPKSNAWFLQGNPLRSLSAFFDGRTPVIGGDYEGQAYMGLGLILLLVAALFVFALARVKINHLLPLVGLCFALSVFAVTHRIAFFDRLYTLPLDHHLLSLLGLVRSSGRLIWPMFYALVIVAVYVISRKITGRPMLVLLAAVACLQMSDLYGWYHSLYVRNRDYSNVYIDILRGNAQFQSLIKNAVEVDLYPVDYIDDFQVYSWEAYKSKIPINTGYLARTPSAEVYRLANARLRDQIDSCNLTPGVLYVVRQVKVKACQGSEIRTMELNNSLLMLRAGL